MSKTTTAFLLALEEEEFKAGLSEGGTEEDWSGLGDSLDDAAGGVFDIDLLSVGERSSDSVVVAEVEKTDY